MAQQLIQNLESGLDARAAINLNFTELYGAIGLPIRLPNTENNTELPLQPNTFIAFIFIQWAFGEPILRIGTEGNGEQILPQQEITFDMAESPLPIAVFRVFMVPTTIYFTISGGQVNISIITTKGIF